MASLLSLPCPKCGHPLGWGQLSGDFRCTSCGARLRSNRNSVAAWTAIFLPLPVGWAFDAGAVWIAIAMVVSLTLYFAVVQSLTTIEQIDQGRAT
jgi:uncharacterized protein (DUF983 family)